MKGITIRISLVFIILIGLCDCNHHEENNTTQRIPRKEFINILADIHIAQAAVYNGNFRETYSNYDSINIVEAVTNSHHYSKQSFDLTITYYTQHAGKYLLVYDAVIKELNKRQNVVFEENQDPNSSKNAPR